jgi:hypothetical protein
MIKSTLSFLIVLCLAATQFIACKKDTTDTPVATGTVAGNFTINSFVSSTDQTAVFDGYHFVFSDNGTITATKENTIATGTWRYDDGNSTEIKISFSSAPLNELNRSWHISELSGARMLLTDDDDSDDHGDDNPSSHHDRLEFERD